MRKTRLQVAAVLAFIFTGIYSGFGQNTIPVSNVPGRAGAQGSLTVTLTVVSSVGVVTGSDGRQRVVVANAAAPSDNVSSLQYVRLKDTSASGDSAARANAARNTRNPLQ